MFKCQTHANISNFSWGFTSNGIGITTEMLISQASWKGSHFVLLNTRSNSATGQRQMWRSFSSRSGAQRLDTETDHGWICWFPVYWLVKIKYSYYGFVHIILNKPVRLTTPQQFLNPSTEHRAAFDFAAARLSLKTYRAATRRHSNRPRDRSIPMVGLKRERFTPHLGNIQKTSTNTWTDHMEILSALNDIYT